MNYDRKKETDPLRTVARVRHILQELDVLTMEEWKNGSANATCYSLRLSAPECGIGTNGKGVTRSYALASAYGEFMERLQNMIMLPVERFSLQDVAREGFRYFPDEELRTEEQVANAQDALSARVFRDYYRDRFLMELGAEQRLKVVRAYAESAVPPNKDGLVTWPFYSVRSHGVVRVWDRFVACLQGSNGMCAGNTPEEALVQGMSEIFERYACQTIMLSQLVPPEIPAEEYGQFDDIAAMVAEIEGMGPYRVSFRDCSLGKGLPVCCALLVDYEHQRYRVSFGGHPVFAIAAERCLTELLQGFDPANKETVQNKMVSMGAGSLLPSLNVLNHQANGMGRFSRSFLCGRPSYEHAPAPDLSQRDNAALLSWCVDLALCLADDVLVRDVSYLGFPAFYIAVPGISHQPQDALAVSMASAGAALQFLGDYRDKTDERTLRTLLMGCVRREALSVRGDMAVPEWRLKLALLLTLGEEDQARAALDQLDTWRMDRKERQELSALKEVLALRREGVSLQEAERLIRMFYPAPTWEVLHDKWLCENPAHKLLEGLPQPQPSVQDQGARRLYLRMKRVFRGTEIRQEDLARLFGGRAHGHVVCQAL